MLNLTPIVRALIAVNVIVFLLQQFFPIGALIALWPIDSGLFAPYQFFSYMFAHVGFMHIFFNMLTLASFAPILESYWGDQKFLLFYIATGIGAAVIYAGANYFLASSMDAGVVGSMVGASGALYGILMAFGMVFPNLEIMLLFPPIPIKAKYMVFLMGFLTYVTDRSGSVAHLAHFGGALVGFVIIMIWRIQGSNRS